MESAKAGYGYNPYKSQYDSWNRQYGGNNSSWVLNKENNGIHMVVLIKDITIQEALGVDGNY